MGHSVNPYGGGNANPGGHGGRRQRIPRVRNATEVGGSSTPPKKCCPMVAALVSVKQGKFRLARRYAVMAVRLTAARFV